MPMPLDPITDLQLKNAALQAIAQLAIEWSKRADDLTDQCNPDETEYAAAETLQSCADDVTEVFTRLGIEITDALGPADPPPPQTFPPPPAAKQR